MPWSALPEHLNSPEKWKGTDWDNPVQRWMLKYKGWLAFGPRAIEWWARWREIPKVLLALRGAGCWRWEFTDGGSEVFDYTGRLLKDTSLTNSFFYLSNIQYYCRWHLVFQWPFHVTFSWYFKESSVPTPGKSTSVTGKVLFIRFGARRDSDIVYWCPSLFVGLTWN